MAIDFNSLSDDQLLAMAGQAGIDVSDVVPQAQVSPGLLNFQQAPNLLGQIPQDARDLVNQEFGAVRDLGTQNIFQQATNLAGRRGLNAFDTPVAEPALRNQALFETQLGGQQAGQLLGLSERLGTSTENALQARTGLFNQARQGQSTLEFLTNQSQEGLRQNALSNRMNLAANAGNLALGLGQLRRPAGSATTQTPSLFQNLQGAQQGALGVGLGLGGGISGIDALIQAALIRGGSGTSLIG